MIVSSNASIKVNAAKLLKVIVSLLFPYFLVASLTYAKTNTEEFINRCHTLMQRLLQLMFCLPLLLLDLTKT